MIFVRDDDRRVVWIRLPAEVRHDDAIVATVATEIEEFVLKSCAERICTWLSGCALLWTKSHQHNDVESTTPNCLLDNALDLSDESRAGKNNLAGMKRTNTPITRLAVMIRQIDLCLGVIDPFVHQCRIRF